MIIAALNESPHDTRVAITPNAIKHYQKLELQIYCEKGAGAKAGFLDAQYEEQGAKIISDRSELLKNVNIIVCINEPSPSDLQDLSSNALVVAPVDAGSENPLIAWCNQHEISLFSMNLIPRISRAQSMDSLSSQANLAGYRAVLEAVNHFHRAIPMMMTAAGMIQPAKILILGAGVAGLQAIATAKRLGAVVYAFDVRLAAKEQVESLGAEFIAVSENENNETKGGYAGEMSEDYRNRQASLLMDYAKQVDIIICTALIPGKKAPELLNQAMVEQMKPGSVIVDLATSRGGNCALSQKDKIIEHQQVSIIGYSNMAGLIPATASELYSGNLVSLMRFLIPSPQTIVFNPDDDIIKQAMLTHHGHYMPFQDQKETSA